MQTVKTWPETISKSVATLSLAVGIAVNAAVPAALADLGAAARSVPSAALVGEGRFSFLGFRVFDAELYAPQGEFETSGPFALKLTYLRNFEGAAIAERSAKEIKAQGSASAGQIDSWTRQMDSIFPDVRAGQSITGVKTANGTTEFYADGRKIGAIQDPAFTQRFFNIWLGAQTKNPSLRAKLVGASG
ncbi:hypothetical protein E1180_01960 [Roseibium denhamense]|uniref:Chalcone isomerase-like n=1 Tax=Roseibium denhamense TaxID=76305 RepID=A0ABY1NEU1_9HYPH|nr:chalcone isomerase family protein [Roseibium denhamense]MTI04281.1 hypothetical protein [Roseibium denhamense]SMP07834.1 Chalcone isomerase-like [Roseibium denhamense]